MLSMDLIFGRNAVRDAAQSDPARIEKVLVQRGISGDTMRRYIADLRTLGISVQFVPVQKLDQLARGERHQGVVAQMSAITYLALDDLLTAVAPTRDDVETIRPLIVVLDRVQDPHNVGAIIRSALAAGAVGVIISARGGAPINAVVVKTSAGAATRLPIARVDRIADHIQALKERGYWVLATDQRSEEPVWAADLTRPTIVIVGNEGEGIHPVLRDRCDHILSIPMLGDMESLNASVAAGIVFFERVRQLGG